MTHLTTLHPQAPYAFDRMLDILSRYAHPTLDIMHDGAYWRALQIGEARALVCVMGHGTVDSPVLAVHRVAQTGAVDERALIDRVRYILSVDISRGAFFDVARADPLLWPVVAPLYGLPKVRAASVFEALANTIIEQQIAWTAAQRGQRWLVEWAGQRIEYDGRTFYTFPTAERLANATIEQLKPLKITNKRSAVLIDIARAVTENRLDLEGLLDETPQVAYERLMRIKGVGHWTAAVTLERTIPYEDYVAHNDVVVQAAVNHYFKGLEGRASVEAVIETFSHYDGFAGSAAYYTLMRWVIDRYPRM